MARKRKISRGHVSRIRSSLRTIRTTRGKPRTVRTVISASCSKHLLSWTCISSSREGNILKWKAAPLGIWTPVECAVDGPACSLRVQSCPWGLSIHISTQWKTNPRLNLHLRAEYSEPKCRPISQGMWNSVNWQSSGSKLQYRCIANSAIPTATDGHRSWEFLPGLN